MCIIENLYFYSSHNILIAAHSEGLGYGKQKTCAVLRGGGGASRGKWPHGRPSIHAYYDMGPHG
jgi:hypothetical protein